MLCADLGDAICLISLNTLKYKGLPGWFSSFQRRRQRFLRQDRRYWRSGQLRRLQRRRTKVSLSWSSGWLFGLLRRRRTSPQQGNCCTIIVFKIDRTPHKYNITHKYATTYRVRSHSKTAQRQHLDSTRSILCCPSAVCVRWESNTAQVQNHCTTASYTTSCAVCGQNRYWGLTKLLADINEIMSVGIKKTICLRLSVCLYQTACLSQSDSLRYDGTKES